MHRWQLKPGVLSALAAPLLVIGCGGGGTSGGNVSQIPLPGPIVNPTPTPNPNSGLDTRPSNTSCVAWQKSTGAITVTVPNAFPSLPTFTNPVGMFQAPADNTRWFVVEQAGRVRVFPNQSSANAISDFIDITSRVASGGELGLLGMAFHPNFASNRLVYLSYTAGSAPRVSRISQFTAAADLATLDPNSEVVLLTLNQPEDNHNGGNIVFGPDGYLYIGFGDGGGGGDMHGTIGNGQSLTTMLGKILRIDVNGAAPYAIPADNPYAGNPRCRADGNNSQNCPEIFAYGFRNPWRFSFDRSTGDLWVGDVGQNLWEEVDQVTRGGNYGWRCREGAHNYNTTGCPASGLIDPVAEYDHSLGNSITGGYVYRGAQFAPLLGRYIFGDFGSGRIWAWIPGGTPLQPTQLADTNLAISSFAQGIDGELYAVNYGSGTNGTLHHLVFAGGVASDNAPAALSISGCIVNASQAASGLIPFSLNAPYWSDGAAKDRWMGLPNGQTIAVAGDGDWQFPAGTILMQTFRLNNVPIETRLLVHHPDDTWGGYTYAWNAAQSDATRVQGGATQMIQGQSWIFPSETQCLLCHTATAGRALGPETAQMNRSQTYATTGKTANQLTTHSSIGTVTPPYSGDPQTFAKLPDPFDITAALTDRARAYLHSNCSGCHRPGGPTSSSMDLRYATPLASTNTCNVSPSSGTLGIPGGKLIAPGSADTSILPARMNRRDANGMPPVGSAIVDADGVTLLQRWINSLTGC